MSRVIRLKKTFFSAYVKTKAQIISGMVTVTAQLIRITCPCSLYPLKLQLTPHFYIAELGFTWVYIIFLFLL